ncbi:putative inorganic phosphate cotransporter [Halotydeus destructor]|nr:putative inorganic phosphate cotransporter [Halotydeus destructor]
MAFSGVRYLILALVTLSTCVDYITRTNINVAIVSMTLPVNHSDVTVTDYCPVEVVTSNTTNTHTTGSAQKFDWSMSTQSEILGAFFYSYVAMQIPAAKVSQAFGGKWVICLGLLGSGVVNLATPLIAHGKIYLMASRLLLGVFQGGIFAAGYGILFAWFPKRQRSTGYALMYAGGNLGSILTTFLSGYLSDHGFAGGWPSVFYVSGIIGVVSAIITIPLMTSKPADHMWITQEELDYLHDDEEESKGSDTIKPPIPWLGILTSLPFWVATYQGFVMYFAYGVVASELPTYLSTILHVNSTENGILNMLPYACTFLSTPFCGLISEFLIKKKVASRTNTRKCFILLYSLIIIACYTALPLFNCDKTVVVTLFTVVIWATGLDSAGTSPTVGEMTNNFPTIVFGLYNTVVVCSGFMAPMVTGYLLDSGPNALHQWNLLFYITAGALLSGMFLSLIFLKAERQPWDEVEKSETEVDKLPRLSIRC